MSTVRFIGNHNNVAPVSQTVINIAIVWLELLYGCKYNSARLYFQQTLKMLTVLCLNRSLAQQLSGACKRIKKLVIQIIAVCNDNYGRIIQALYNLAGVENHSKRLATTLCVPYHTCAMVTRLLLLNCLETEIGRRFGYAFIHARCPQCGINSLVNGIVLVICGYLFYRLDCGQTCLEVFLFLFLKYSERAYQVKQCVLAQHAIYKNLQFTYQM